MEAGSFEAIVEALKVAVATLRDAEVPFLLGGSVAAWVRGAPQPQKDLDLMLRPGDAERALEALAAAGMRTERPPEQWLYKAWHGKVMIDLIFHPSGLELGEAVFSRAETVHVMAVTVPVMAIEDVLVAKLCSLDEHTLNFTPLLGIVRALREQIDWPQLEARTDASPYARTFFTLVRELGVAPAAGAGGAASGGATGSAPGGSRVRVVPAS